MIAIGSLMQTKINLCDEGPTTGIKNDHRGLSQIDDSLLRLNSNQNSTPHDSIEITHAGILRELSLAYLRLHVLSMVVVDSYRSYATTRRATFLYDTHFIHAI